MDSGRVEMYFENGKIRQQSEWKDKQIVAVKEWNENGVLTKEVSLPTYYKEYWDNGKQKGRIIGILYKNDQDVVSADSGYSESYFENEKIYQHNEWKDKKIIAQKEWNENGVLVKDTDFPKYSKEYWDNGKLKQIFTGILHRKNDLCSFSPDSGHSELFFENGKIKEQTDWRDKQAIASKIWNENGVLIKDIDYPKHYKEYWDNGKPKFVSTGLLYRNGLGNFDLDSGHQEIYFENGKIKEQSDWKNKQFFTSKRWIESGVQVVDLDFPKYLKQYWDNGKPQNILTGLLYRDDQGNIQIESGRAEVYFENGEVFR
jgi:antitoxin component YwqK of YwqJK toxin-antitoxin module